MACKCITETGDFLVKHLKAKNPDTKYLPIDEIGLGLRGTTFVMGDNAQRMKFEFKVRSQFKKVNGQMSVPKTQTVVVVATFCPFCGTKYQQD